MRRPHSRNQEHPDDRDPDHRDPDHRNQGHRNQGDRDPDHQERDHRDRAGTGGPASWRRHPSLLLATLVYTGLIVAVIGTLGTPLIPTIARAQGVSLTTAQWLLTLTLLVSAVTTPLLGRLGDGPHRRVVLVGGLGTVTVGSVVAATASRFPQLLIGRGLMGVGMGLMPLAIAAARDHLPRERLAPGIAALSITAATGAGLGYPLSGVLADAVDYHAGFWFAAGLSGFAIVAVLLVLPGRDAAQHADGRVDLPGAALFGGALGALLLALSEGDSWGWTSSSVLGLTAAAVVLAGGWVAVELRTRRPLVVLRYLALRPVLIADLTGVLAGFGLFLAMTLVNRLAQAPTSTGYGFGASPAVTGLVIIPLSVGTVIASRAARVLGRRAGGRGLLLTGSVAIAAALFGLAVGRDHLAELAGATFLLGVGIGMAFAAMPALIIGCVPPAETGSATSFNQVLRTAGGSMGSALGAALLAAHTPAGSAAPTASGYTVACVVGGAVCLAAALVALALPGPARGAPSTDAHRQEVESAEEESGDAAAAGLILAGNVPLTEDLTLTEDVIPAEDATRTGDAALTEDVRS